MVSHPGVPNYQDTDVYLDSGLLLVYVVKEEARKSRYARSVSDIEGNEPKIWEISPGDIECDHPPDQLRDLGIGGLNGYYLCERCEGGLIIQNEVDYLVNR